MAITKIELECPVCGEALLMNCHNFCPKCGYNVKQLCESFLEIYYNEVADPMGSKSKESERPKKKVKKSSLVIASFFGGWLGIDRFMTGHYGMGMLKLFTGGLFGLFWLADFLTVTFQLWEDVDGYVYFERGRNWQYARKLNQKTS